MKIGTVINCTDGRVKYPVLDYLKNHFEINFFHSEVEEYTRLKPDDAE